jgi:hypothetical protein
VSGAGGSGAAGGSSAAGGSGAEAGEPRMDASTRRSESGAKQRDSTTAESLSLPDPATFSSGAHGTVAGKRRAVRRGGDRAFDAWLVASGTRRRIGVLAKRVPIRDVLIAAVHAPDSPHIAPALDELRASRHNVRIASGSTADLHGGKFENLTVLLDDQAAADWTLVIDDDVVLPHGFLDGFVALAEAFAFELAQPAQTLASHAAWSSARRAPFSVARQTNFVEIGPVTAFSRIATAELLPFPPLKMGWGLDLHWGAVAQARGWKIGVIDALPVRHETRRVGGSYSPTDATAEAQRFLAGRPYISAADAGRTLHAHRAVPS